jgi:acyl-CoA reductase-like NAD-dependent aldehyde dehydrogenase
MSQSDGNRTLLRFPGERREFSVARPSTRDYALLEELSFVRREAQAEANIAYEDWRLRPGGEAYAVYRAAQDRADAAQDELARWVRQIVQ